MIRIGLIGAGKAAKLHAAAAAAVPEMRPVAVADLDPARGEPLAGQLGARYVREARDLLALAVDAVIIALPHACLAPAALAAIEAGKHVLLEKPMGVTLDEADRVIAAARAARVVLQIGYVHRYRPEIQAAKQRVAGGSIGRPTLVVEDHCLSGDHTVGSWVWEPAINGGGALFYSGIHGLDRIRWLTGQDVQLAFAQMDRFAHDRGLDDNAAATLRLSGGCLAAVNQNFTPFSIPNRWQTHLYGSEGVLRIADGGLEVVDRAGGRSVALVRHDHFEMQLREFVSAIRDGRPPAVPGDEGRANLAAMLAIYESARTGQPVEIEAAAAGTLPIDVPSHSRR